MVRGLCYHYNFCTYYDKHYNSKVTCVKLGFADIFLVDYLRMGFTLLFSELLLGGLNETNADLSPLCYVSLVENAVESVKCNQK